MSSASDPGLEHLSRRFAAHAEICGGKSPGSVSPFYAALAREVARDLEVLALVQDADPATQIPNLLFGAVNTL